MNITLNNSDPVNATLTIEVKKEDYAPEVKKSLKKIKDTATIPGFRPKMAPAGMIQKMYGKSVLIEEVNKLVSDKLFGYIKENQLNILGEPMPHEDDREEPDFDNENDYTFIFDIALAPDIQVNLSKDDTLPYYNVKVEKKQVDEAIESLQRNYGTYEQAESVEDNDMVKGLLIELNPDGSHKAEGIRNEGALLLPSYVKNEEEKAKFIGAKKGDTITFNPHKAYEGNAAELSSFLNVGREDIENHTGDFSFTIEEITRHQKAALGKDLYDRIFGDDVIKTKKDMEAKIKEEFAAQTKSDSDYLFLLEARKLMMEKSKDVVFPDAFLKRWLMASDAEHTAESLEEDYPKIIDDLRFHLIKEQLIKENEIKVDYEEVKQMATNAAKAQFAQYGMHSIPTDVLEQYTQEMLKKEDTVRNLINRVTEDKLIEVLKDKITLEPKEIKRDDFNHLIAESEK